MLTLPRICLLISVVTGMALCWVHQQVELVTTSYQIAQLQKELTELEWTRSHLQYHIFTLESPIQLDQKLHQAGQSFSFRDPVLVVHLEPSPKLDVHSSKISGSRHLLEFFVHSAEAKQSEKEK